MESPDRKIIELIVKDIQQGLDPIEKEELEAWLKGDPEHRAIYDRLNHKRGLLESVITHRRALGRRKQVRKRVVDKVMAELAAPVKVRHLRSWLPWAAAACVLLAMAAGSFWVFDHGHEHPSVAVTPARGELGPGRNRAILILSDNKQVTLDDVRQGSIARQGNTEIAKTDSTLLTYRTQAIVHNLQQVQFNTVITPRGGQYRLQLADGSVVFLNAQSSLYFPVTFDGKERRVVLQGEGYFEVAPDPRRPFRVELKSGREITVLGTRFDVRAYADDRIESATLLQGSVRVVSGAKSVVLAPEERVVAAADGSLQVARDDNAESSIAWTRGLFRFQDAPLGDVMRQIARWYDVDVVFNGALPDVHITASINRNTNAWEVLDALKEIAHLKYTIEGRKVIVSN